MDLRYGSFTHLEWSSLPLKELSSALRAPCIGWESFSNGADSFAVTLLSPTICTESRGHLKTELVFMIIIIKSNWKKEENAIFIIVSKLYISHFEINWAAFFKYTFVVDSTLYFYFTMFSMREIVLFFGKTFFNITLHYSTFTLWTLGLVYFWYIFKWDMKNKVILVKQLCLKSLV